MVHVIDLIDLDTCDDLFEAMQVYPREELDEFLPVRLWDTDDDRCRPARWASTARLSKLDSRRRELGKMGGLTIPTTWQAPPLPMSG